MNRPVALGCAVMAALLLTGAQSRLRFVPATESAEPATTYCSPVSGQVHYVLSSATGSNDGSNWNNAFTSLSSAEALASRGDTICVGDGTYTTTTFNTAASGTTVITVAKATVSDHGSIVGWTDAMGDGQATFTGWTVTSSYWHFTGVTGGGPGDSVADWPESWEDNLGFVINGNVGGTSTGGTKLGLVFEHIEVNGGVTAAGGPRAFDIWDLDGLTIRYCYIHNWGEDTFRFAIGTSNFTVEYSKIANMWQDGSNHADVVESSGTGSPYLIRWNYLQDVVGSYWFGSHTGTIAVYEVYGNIFDGRTKALEATNGVMSNLSGGGSLPAIAYCNNTLAGIWGIYQMGIVNSGGGTVAGVARSNLYYRSSGSSAIAIGITQSANTVYNETLTSGENLTGDPFVSYSTYDLRVASDTTAGSLSGCPAGNSVDMFGVTRAKPTRGALEKP